MTRWRWQSPQLLWMCSTTAYPTGSPTRGSRWELCCARLFFGWKGLGSAVAGCLLAGGIVFLFYAVRAMGAGDVKLLAAIGASWDQAMPSSCFWPPRFAVECWPLFMQFTVGASVQLSGTSASVLQFHSSSGMQAHPELNLDNPSALRMPYGLAIAAGTLYSFVGTWWR